MCIRALEALAQPLERLVETDESPVENVDPVTVGLEAESLPRASDGCDRLISGRLNGVTVLVPFDV